MVQRMRIEVKDLNGHSISFMELISLVEGVESEWLFLGAQVVSGLDAGLDFWERYGTFCRFLTCGSSERMIGVLRVVAGWGGWSGSRCFRFGAEDETAFVADNVVTVTVGVSGDEMSSHGVCACES